MGGAGCPRKGTGVVPPLPAAQTVTVRQGSQTEVESAAAKKADANGSGQNVGMNLTRTATPAPSQTLISSATYTQIQPHSLIQQQQQIHLQQKQVVIQQQIAIHHQQQFQHRQSQLLHTATHLHLAQQQQQQATTLTAPQPPQVPPTQQVPPSQSQQQAQTLVVQPMLQSSPRSLPPDPTPKLPIPIQSKPPVAPIKPPQSGAMKMSATQQLPPHIPVQVVGTWQPGDAKSSAAGPGPPGLLLAFVSGSRHTARMSSCVGPRDDPCSCAGDSTCGKVVAQVPAAFYMQSVHLPAEPQMLAVKRKAESEEERDEVSTLASVLPAKASPAAESPKVMEEKSSFAEKADPGTSVNANTPSSELIALAPVPGAPPPSLAMVSRQVGDSKPPQAIVKPQILTHIIEGFVIQEGAEPFPVGCSQLLKESEKPLQTGLPAGLSESQSSGSLGGDSPGDLDKKANLLKCEYCGKYTPAEQFQGSKRFCSMTCAKRYNVSCSHQFQLKRKKMKEFQEANYARVRSNPSRWSVEEVYEFIASLQGCQEIAEEFRSQEIDGQALLLLKEEHLMSAMNIKLGPALKICAKINVLKET
ncbi:Polyhomeotic-like protein 1 [Heterocephalus glaber]|uniref:Polyhomeotic-like protein 1 n=1 Tax=Heterocephalus glaber TaxID=10181 RepID=G5ARK2_HETGA|nr:Polyhomeotic-like protein 1 [Heterocephalus glaber]